MDKIVTIKEGGITRRLAPIDKLKINTTDNKESTWVASDKANTGVLHASENGIYIASEDGYETYSEVIVRVTKDSFEGDTSFDDWDYETPDMDLDNWDPETIEDFELDPDGFDDVFNNEDEWKDIDKPIDIKMDNPKIQDTKISGIDPVTGNEMEVGLDADGYLTESTLPSSIKIEIPPDKHQYVDGQPILFRGMIVKGYTADGELWTDSTHPDGIIPHSELTFPVTTAIYEGGDGATHHKSDLIDIEIATYDSLYSEHDQGGSFGISYDNITPIDSDTVLIVQRHTSRTRAGMFASKHNGDIGIDNYRLNGKTRISIYKSTERFTYNGKTVYYIGFRAGGNIEADNWHPDIQEDAFPYLSGQVAWTALYGEVTESPGMQIVPVQYIRSDGEILEDSFTIEVLPDPDGAHPQVDPSTVEWNHRRYKANEDLGAVEVRHGSVYMENGAIYDVGAAVRLGMLEPVDNEIVP